LTLQVDPGVTFGAELAIAGISVKESERRRLFATTALTRIQKV
jgi:hypothetical protein